MSTFKAFRISMVDGCAQRKIVQCSLDDLPEGDVLIKVSYSGLNYKDALSASGHTGITRQFPHTPGIDAAGIVVSDQSATFVEGDPVVVIGFDLGMNTWGGFSEYIRVPKAWVISLPDGLSLADAMKIGTAGLTAAYSVEKLINNGLHSHDARVLVTGATGGVGSFSVALLSALGYQVTASTGKPEQAPWLQTLGASEVVDRQLLAEPSKKALLPATYDAVVDCVGQQTLINAIKLLKFGGSVAACGIVGGTQLAMDIYPFILRGVNLLGIASADATIDDRRRVLAKFVTLWRLNHLDEMVEEITFNEIDDRINQMLAGTLTRRVLIKVCS